MSCSPMKVCRWSNSEGIWSKRIREQSWHPFGVQVFGQTRSCRLVFLCLLLMLQGADTLESPKPYLSSARGSAELGFVFPAPRNACSEAAGLPLALEQLTVTSPYRHLQVLAVGLPCGTTPVSVASRWLRELTKSVVLFAHWQKGEGRFTC